MDLLVFTNLIYAMSTPEACLKREQDFEDEEICDIYFTRYGYINVVTVFLTIIELISLLKIFEATAPIARSIQKLFWKSRVLIYIFIVIVGIQCV